jgi:Mrp family chromosome partitioning ATPase
MRNTLEALYSRNAKVLGIIFNGVDPKQPEYGYYKYTEYYYSKTVSRKKPAGEPGTASAPEVAVRAEEGVIASPATGAHGSAGGPPAITVKKA